MHVIFFSFNLPGPGEPGAGRPWEELRLINDLGWRVTAVTSSTNYQTGVVSRPVRGLWRTDMEGETTIIRTWAPSDYRSSLTRRMVCYLAFSLIAPLAALTARHVDVVFTATDPPFSTPGAYLSARLHRARLVIDERDVYPDAPLAVGVQPPKLLVRSLTKWFRWLRGQATSVITVSPGLKSVLIKRGASEDRTFVIPNYFPRSTRTLEPKRVDDEHRDVTVLYAGGLGRANDVSTCLEAAAIVNETGAGCVRFEFVGGGERLEEFVEWCSRKGHGRIAFLGAFPRGEMGPVYRRADIGISALPAHPYWRHALINKVFAYMEHGCPVVFAGEGDIESMLLESGAGLVVPPEDPTAMAEAILRLVRDKQLRQRMGMRGQSYMNTRFSYEQVSGLMQSALAAG